MNAFATPYELQLHSLNHLGRRIRVFSNWQEACRHLRDHLLTSPECEAWTLVTPEYLEVLDSADRNARLRYLNSALESCGATAQDLYDIYHGAVRDDNADAEMLGWTSEDVDAQVTYAFGTSGVLLIASRAFVITAYLPGQGDAWSVAQAHDSANQTGLPREQGMRSGRPGWPKESDHDRCASERRRAERTPDANLFYDVFMRAVGRIKRSHHVQRDMRGEWLRDEYALLKNKLPPRSGLDLEGRNPCSGAVFRQLG